MTRCSRIGPSFGLEEKLFNEHLGIHNFVTFPSLLRYFTACFLGAFPGKVMYPSTLAWLILVGKFFLVSEENLACLFVSLRQRIDLPTVCRVVCCTFVVCEPKRNGIMYLWSGKNCCIFFFLFFFLGSLFLQYALGFLRCLTYRKDTEYVFTISMTELTELHMKEKKKEKKKEKRKKKKKFLLG